MSRVTLWSCTFLLLPLLVQGCHLQHGLDAVGRGGDGGSPSRLDGGTTGPGDSSIATARDARVGPSDASRTLPDAGPRPGLDAGPPGDRLGEIWEGYIDKFEFPSGAGCDRLRIVFDSAPPGDGPRTGIVTFGCGAPLPPVTNPEVGYPDSASEIRIYEGFEYPITEGRVSMMGTRVQVQTDSLLVWSEWCALQAPVPLERRPGWGCLPEWDSTRDDSGCVLLSDTGALRVDCGKLALCWTSPVCQCNEAGCMVGTPSSFDIGLDFAVVGDRGDGTASLAPGRLHMRRTR